MLSWSGKWDAAVDVAGPEGSRIEDGTSFETCELLTDVCWASEARFEAVLLAPRFRSLSFRLCKTAAHSPVISPRCSSAKSYSLYAVRVSLSMEDMREPLNSFVLEKSGCVGTGKSLRRSFGRNAVSGGLSQNLVKFSRVTGKMSALKSILSSDANLVGS